jgi:hypothetical protein
MKIILYNSRDGVLMKRSEHLILCRSIVPLMMAHSQHNAHPTYHVKETQLNTIERYYIYAEFSENNLLNDEHTLSPNKTLYALLKPHQP